jgi:magnesium chelatase family protein
MLAKTFGSAVHGVDAKTIMVEVSVGQGLRYFMSGLPDNAIKESQHRVESAMKSCNFFMPRNKTVVNLAPADIRKEGSAYEKDQPMTFQLHFAFLKPQGKSQLNCSINM